VLFLSQERDCLHAPSSRQTLAVFSSSWRRRVSASLEGTLLLVWATQHGLRGAGTFFPWSSRFSSRKDSGRIAFASSAGGIATTLLWPLSGLGGEPSCRARVRSVFPPTLFSVPKAPRPEFDRLLFSFSQQSDTAIFRRSSTCLCISTWYIPLDASTFETPAKTGGGNSR
jgi:hypothetical protein